MLRLIDAHECMYLRRNFMICGLELLSSSTRASYAVKMIIIASSRSKLDDQGTLLRSDSSILLHFDVIRRRRVQRLTFGTALAGLFPK